MVICGAGIAGLTLANRLATSGADTVLLERSPVPRPEGYMIDFFGPGYDTAAAMGLLPALRAVSYDIDEAQLVNEHGRCRARVRPALFAEQGLLDLMRPDLERVLREALPAAVDLRFGSAVCDVADLGDGIRVTLEDGSQVDADLLVGADGLHSTVRRLVFGPDSMFLRYLGFHTAAFTFHDTGIRSAMVGHFCLTDSIDRQVGLYALRDGRIAVLAVHRCPDSTPPDDVRSAIRQAYSGLGWLVPDVLDRCPAEHIYYDQVAQVVMSSWHKGRVVLLGDAGYAVSLIAGQGASLAMAGAYVLADRLHEAESIEEALLDFEAVWRPMAEEKQRKGRAGTRWFLPSSAWQIRVRHVVLRCTRLPFVDHLVATALVGKSSGAILEPDRTRMAKSLRTALAAPTVLYANGFGWLLGRRFLCLTHTGRRSGHRYRTVLEVIGADRGADEYLVIAGFGRSSDWLRNIEAHDDFEVIVGRDRFSAVHRVLSGAEAESAMASYERAHRWIVPLIRRVLTRLLGWRYDSSPAARARLARQLPVVALSPRSPS
ncbi:hypothetical protein BST22_08760 [Mycolicibacterium chubuense]|nr:hypothetical protein BST22_08760 [Mycolicibacterium chubuense]